MCDVSYFFWPHPDPRYLVLCNVEVFGSNQTKEVMWPHPSLLVIEHSKPGQSCVDACSAKQLVQSFRQLNLSVYEMCAYFRLVNMATSLSLIMPRLVTMSYYC